jgi:hypothetical protein
MDNKKRRTKLRHMCDLCYKSYSRLWVLKRHSLDQHGIQALGDTIGQVNSNGLLFPKSFEILIQMQLISELREVNSKLSGVESDVSADKINLKAARMLIKPAYDDIQKQATFFKNWLDLYVPLPKVLVSGFSCYLCPRCLAQEPPIPIKDRGVDLTCEGRHFCRTTSHEFNNLTQNQRASNMFKELYRNIDLWIPGKKLIIAKKITVPSGIDDDSIRKYVENEYDVPNKYHLEDVDNLRSPWIPKLLHNGKMEPTPQELDDFCCYCVGTYAILRIRDVVLFEYYSVFLSSAESIEPDSRRPNTSR